jgi:xanthine dehydrogenase small subunit
MAMEEDCGKRRGANARDESSMGCAIVVLATAGAAMTQPFRFLLNGAPVAVTGTPQTTLLDWLRETRGLTGTKEGCAEGDCGACTVVVAERRRAAPATVPSDASAALLWRPVNACLRFLPSLHGKAVFTVEGLHDDDGRLHPVQRALVDAHGSQCGFCTPGFVMSLFALYKQPQAPTREAVLDALAGNLCRCTGYRPIVDAALAMRGLPACSGWRAPGGALDAEERALGSALAAIDGPDCVGHRTGGQRWLAPRTLAALLAERVAHPQALLVAGATDVGLWVTKERRVLPDLLYTGAVAELNVLDRDDDGGLRIGAAVTLDHAFTALDRDYPELHEGWMRFASPPIRSSGTLGGNVANGSPIGDAMPALIALQASVELTSTRGTRTLPLEDFYLAYRKTALAPDEVLVAVHVPARPAGLHLRAYKVAKRHDQDISAVFAAFGLVRDGERVARARIGCGGVAAVPARARHAEAELTGAPWSAATFERAADVLAAEFTPLDDLRASAVYRRAVLGNLLRRAWLELSATQPVRVGELKATA